MKGHTPIGEHRRASAAKETGWVLQRRSRGAALLAVLWLVAGLSAIAFALSTTVLGETERTSTAVQGARCYYVAAGAIERAILYMQWGPHHKLPGGQSRYFDPGTPLLNLSFPTGEVQVEIIPETAKLGLNSAPPDVLFRLLTAYGLPLDRAATLAEAILDWRAPGPHSARFDQVYLSRTPSFHRPRASFEETEELLLVEGMTPDLFYGTYESDAQGQLHSRAGLRDCLSVLGSTDRFDVNTAHPAVLVAAGLTPPMADAIAERRRIQPFRTEDELQAFGQASGRLRIGGNSIYTLRATARLRLENGQLSDTRRSVAALVKFMPPGYDATYHILRWYDNAWKN